MGQFKLVTFGWLATEKMGFKAEPWGRGLGTVDTD